MANWVKDQSTHYNTLGFEEWKASGKHVVRQWASFHKNVFSEPAHGSKEHSQILREHTIACRITLVHVPVIMESLSRQISTLLMWYLSHCLLYSELLDFFLCVFIKSHCNTHGFKFKNDSGI